MFGGLALAATVAFGGARDRAAPPPPLPQSAIEGDRVRFLAGHLPTLTMPDGATRQVRSVLNTPDAMHYGDYRWNDDGVADGPVWVRVDLAQQTVSVFRGGDEIGTAVILYGTDGKPTPTGTFPILEKAAEHRSTLYDAEMPFMLRLTGDGVAIHASAVRQGAATHGCIGVPPAFAERLFAVVKRGDPVAILPARTDPAQNRT
ncbi:L,D-transpeptidase family protein [Sphingomonas sp. KR1UV-12]|uniref:L,D-transpeptidase family protein n=1 Tax=Sphingomonas aurea TaxID=3063994 RepID=A0ABT9EMF9_9SPHN|nr:L,D-transpeptidase family protein [Sphingomonas sp. KR1UV-12]MDP1027833.1 L,D-transpeptidase family protein [Sphingomonas sp. KR1UV-12]